MSATTTTVYAMVSTCDSLADKNRRENKSHVIRRMIPLAAARPPFRGTGGTREALALLLATLRRALFDSRRRARRDDATFDDVDGKGRSGAGLQDQLACVLRSPLCARAPTRLAPPRLHWRSPSIGLEPGVEVEVIISAYKSPRRTSCYTQYECHPHEAWRAAIMTQAHYILRRLASRLVI